ncbi:MAG TPA: DUF2950 domain-containing protein [Casimicrobiaceae bacterium]|nr:DUF2950 domain-containing protein [Casimicrobiaceae bacterium]
MIHTLDSIPRIRARGWRGAVVALLAMCFAAPVGAATAATAQRSFDSAEAAASALVLAVRAHDRAAMLAILGADAGNWISSGDASADRAAAAKFVAAYDQKHTIATDGETRATLEIGPDDWPFAFPLVKAGAGWHFDTRAGKTELLARRIGANELAVINVMLAIVDAEHDYASADHNRNGVPEYAGKFISSPGKQDGLYWPTKAGEPESPLGPLVTGATAEGYTKSSKGPTPYHGYYFRMLKGQGPHAKGGASDYVVRGWRIGGFAAIAYPARYENSGVMTFMVNHDGVVYQKDLGPETAKIARRITRFDPGPGWTPTAPK